MAAYFQPRPAERIYMLPGNHESARQIEEFCARHGFVNFHGKTAEVGGVRVAGLGYSTITPFDTPGEYTEEQFAERLAVFAEYKPQVLVCHSPPLNTPLDRIRKPKKGSCWRPFTPSGTRSGALGWLGREGKHVRQRTA